MSLEMQIRATLAKYGFEWTRGKREEVERYQGVNAITLGLVPASARPLHSWAFFHFQCPDFHLFAVGLYGGTALPFNPTDVPAYYHSSEWNGASLGDLISGPFFFIQSRTWQWAVVMYTTFFRISCGGVVCRVGRHECEGRVEDGDAGCVDGRLHPAHVSRTPS